MRAAVGSLSIRKYWLLAGQGADQVAPDHKLRKKAKNIYIKREEHYDGATTAGKRRRHCTGNDKSRSKDPALPEKRLQAGTRQAAELVKWTSNWKKIWKQN